MKTKTLNFSYYIFFLCIFTIQILYFALIMPGNNSNYIYFSLGIVFLFTYYQLYHLITVTLAEDKTAAQLSALLIQQKLEKEQTETLTERKNKTKSFQSGIQKELMEFQTMLQEQKYASAHHKLSELTSNFENQRFHPYCNDNLIHAILEGKKMVAARYHIDVHYKITLPDTSSISSVDLSSVLFNLMDNGIEACIDSGITDSRIALYTETAAGFLFIHMVNSKNPEQNFDGQTTKKDTDFHGFGLSIIQDICRRNDGTCQLEDYGDTFHSLVMLRCTPAKNQSAIF